jgi:hypothetical protein
METRYGYASLDDGIRSRRIDGVNGLSMHILEAGHRQPDSPWCCCCMGFPN